MSTTYVERTRKIIPCTFLFFLEAGTVVDSVTVSATAKPDNNPDSNWLLRPCTLSFDIERKFNEEVIKCAIPGVGWREETQRNLLSTRYIFDERTSTEHFERLFWGLKSKVVAATAQTPSGADDPSITGWLKIEMESEGGKLGLADIWGVLRLKGNTKADGNSTKPQYEFEQRHSDLNTIVFPV